MIARRRVVKGWNTLLRFAGHALYAYPGVASVVAASMIVNMRKHFVWNCFVLLALSS